MVYLQWIALLQCQTNAPSNPPVEQSSVLQEEWVDLPWNKSFEEYDPSTWMDLPPPGKRFVYEVTSRGPHLGIVVETS